MAKCAIHFLYTGVLLLLLESTGFLLCESWQFITAAVKRGNKEWQKLFYSQGNGVSEDLFGKVMALCVYFVYDYYIYHHKRAQFPSKRYVSRETWPSRLLHTFK